MFDQSTCNLYYKLVIDNWNNRGHCVDPQTTNMIICWRIRWQFSKIWVLCGPIHLFVWCCVLTVWYCCTDSAVRCYRCHRDMMNLHNNLNIEPEESAQLKYDCPKVQRLNCPNITKDSPTEQNTPTMIVPIKRPKSTIGIPNSAFEPNFYTTEEFRPTTREKATSLTLDPKTYQISRSNSPNGKYFKLIIIMRRFALITVGVVSIRLIRKCLKYFVPFRIIPKLPKNILLSI